MNEPGRIRVVVADEVAPWPEGKGERDPWEPKPRRPRPMHPERVAYLGRLARATDRARQVLKPGDRITRSMCGGRRGTFTFTGWDGANICGKTVDDCGATSVLKVNGKPVDFDDPEPRPEWIILFRAVQAADKLATASTSGGTAP